MSTCGHSKWDTVFSDESRLRVRSWITTPARSWIMVQPSARWQVAVLRQKRDSSLNTTVAHLELKQHHCKSSCLWPVINVSLCKQCLDSTPASSYRRDTIRFDISAVKAIVDCRTDIAWCLFKNCSNNPVVINVWHKCQPAVWRPNILRIVRSSVCQYNGRRSLKDVVVRCISLFSAFTTLEKRKTIRIL